MMQRMHVFQSSAQPAQSHQELQALVGRALVDPEFSKDLLNGHRSECLTEFALTADEFIAASTAEADDLATFAAQIDRWIQGRRDRIGSLTAAA